MRHRTTPSTLFLAFLVGGLGVFVLHTALGFGGPRLNGLFSDGIYNVLMFGAAAAILTRGALVKSQRAAWLTMGAGVLCWSLGELYSTLFLAGPGVAGAHVSAVEALLSLAFYPCCYVALVLLVGAHLRELRIGMWLDGLISGLAAATVGAALLPPIVSHAHGDIGSVAVSLASPIGDLLLLVFTVGAIGMTGWRPGRVWLLIAIAMLASAVADSVYLYATATAGHTLSTWLVCLWPTSAILLAIAAWTPWAKFQPSRVEDWRLIVVPALSLLGALGVFIYGDLPGNQLTAAAIVLAAATVLAVSVHLMMTLRENLAMLVGSREMALTDPLTGLGNRRLLIEDLHVVHRRAQDGEPWELVLYDLNGFKRYNDTFGHPAGDALLARLSGKLSEAVAPHGTAYRMGGDEFCVLFRGAHTATDALIAASLRALSEQGPGFVIDAAHGVVAITTQIGDPAAVMQLADQRLYRRKDLTRESSAVHQLRDVLLQAFQERYPDLQEHQRGVGALVLAVGRRLGMSAEDLDVLARAAELHDVGKIAIPDAILHKPGPLDAQEWRFMRRHTILGERILTAASALRPVARLVRSSHERFDGGGYPDGLAGEQIPLGARVIFVCDAFDAMTSNRSYSSAVSRVDALSELHRCAGTQFDPRVVAAFADTLREDIPSGADATQAASPDAQDLQHRLALGQNH